MVAGAALRGLAESRCQRVRAFLKMAEPRFRYFAQRGTGLWLCSICLELVIGEHLHGLERIVVEIFADQRKLLQDVIGHGDDLTSNGLGVEDVQQFAQARPDQLGTRRHLQQPEFHARSGH